MMIGTARRCWLGAARLAGSRRAIVQRRKPAAGPLPPGILRGIHCRRFPRDEIMGLVATYTDSPENLNWVPVEDDRGRWALPPDIEGGPFAALPCDVDGSPVEIGEDEVRCPKCGKHTAPPLR